MSFVVVVQLLSRVRLFVTPWTVARQAPPSPTVSWSLLKFMSIELVMLSNHLILCCPLLLMPTIFPSIRVLSSELALHIRWPKDWSFSFNNSPSNESGLISFRMDWLDLLGVHRILKGLLHLLILPLYKKSQIQVDFIFSLWFPWSSSLQVCFLRHRVKKGQEKTT